MLLDEQRQHERAEELREEHGGAALVRLRVRVRGLGLGLGLGFGFGFGLGFGLGLGIGLGLGLGLDPNLHERAAQLLHVEGRQLEPLGEGVHELDDHELQPGRTLQLGRQVDAWLGLGEG